MQTQKYSIQQPLTESLLADEKEGEIAIPEIQRPFVRDKSKVRDRMDSIYRGYPVGDHSMEVHEGSENSNQMVVRGGVGGQRSKLVGSPGSMATRSPHMMRPTGRRC